MKRVAIIILHYGEINNTLECLASVEKLNRRNDGVLVIVVDNGSKEKSKIQNVKLNVDGVTTIRNEENLGYAGGNNVGIRYALEQGADFVLLLNNDTLVDQYLIASLLESAESNSEVGIIAPKIYFAAGFEFHKERYNEKDYGAVIWFAGGIVDWKNVVGRHRGVDEVDGGQYKEEGDTDFASGCCMFVKREVYEKIGLFDEKYFLYYEDSDFSLRAKRAGFKIVFAPRAMLWHKNAGAAGGSGSSLQDYYITRNRLLFAMRYAPIRSKIALVRESARLLLSAREWQKRGVIDFYRRKFGKGSYPL